MSYGSGVGSERNLLDETPEHAHQLSMQTPILFDRRAAEAAPRRLVDLRRPHAGHHVAGRRGPGGHGARAGARVRRGRRGARRRRQHPHPVRPRRSCAERAPIPSLLAVAGVHHHLVREGTRLQTGLVLESGEPREVHHFATLIGYGASAINPYLMWESLAKLVADGRVPGVEDFETARGERRQGHRQGPAQDDLQDGDLDDPVLHGRADLRGRRARRGAGGAPLHRHRVADRRHRRRGAGDRDAGAPRPRLRPAPLADDLLPVGGVYAWRREGEHHMWNPETIALLQHSVRAGGQPTYEEYSKLVNEDAAAAGHAARAAGVPGAARGRVAAAGRDRAGERDRQALRHRRDVARLAGRARRTRRWRSP